MIRKRSAQTRRDLKGYRAAKRNNAINWKGVKVDRREELPKLIKVTSLRGEVSYKVAEE